MEKVVSVIIPAYNEGPRIDVPIRILKTHPLVDEVIVVSDGSTDDTAECAHASGAQVFTLPENKGKGAAMDYGIRKAKNNIIFFCDADMRGFSHDGVSRVLGPVIRGKAIMCIGTRPIAFFPYSLLPSLLRFSGMRAISRTLWHRIPNEFARGYQIETTLNYFAERSGQTIHTITVPGLTHSVKEVKYGLMLGLRKRIEMIREIAHVFFSLKTHGRADHKPLEKKEKEGAD